MKFLGNLLWLLLGGILVALMYWLCGLLMCITIVGIPFGVQLFKFGTFALWPFGHELRNNAGETGCLSTIMNIIWILCGWWEIALTHLCIGVLLCITIVGIPLSISSWPSAASCHSARRSFDI